LKGKVEMPELINEVGNGDDEREDYTYKIEVPFTKCLISETLK